MLNRLSEGNFRPVVPLTLLKSCMVFSKDRTVTIALVTFGAKIQITPAAIAWQPVQACFES
jgi:hypothetical protein